MKAAVYYSNGGPDVFRYEEVDDPRCSRDGVLIKVEAISIEGADLVNRELRPLQRVPHAVGYQCAGTILEVGGAVLDRLPGQKVVAMMGWGSHAEIAAAPARDTWIIPSSMEIDTAAAVPIAWGTAHDSLFELGRLESGETILIHSGAGALGLASIQLAKRAGARVLATASDDVRLARLAEYGVDVGINHATSDFVEQVMRATGGTGVDMVLDGVGGENLPRSISALSYRGRVISVLAAGRDDQRPDPISLWHGNKSLQGVCFAASLDAEHDRVHGLVSGLLEDITAGLYRVAIDRAFPLSSAAEAHRYISDRKAFGRVLLKP